MRTPTSLVRDLASREVVTVPSTATLRQCAQAMRAGHVGSLILVDAGSARPLGLVTDRDIILEAVAVGLDVDTMTAGDIATRPLATVRDEDELVEAMARMRECGVRRLPVVGVDGHLCGIVALDDIVAAVAEHATSIVSVIAAEKAKESATRR